MKKLPYWVSGPPWISMMEGYFLAGSKSGRGHDPALQIVAIRALEPDFLYLAEFDLIQQSRLKWVSWVVSPLAMLVEHDLAGIIHLP